MERLRSLILAALSHSRDGESPVPATVVQQADPTGEFADAALEVFLLLDTTGSMSSSITAMQATLDMLMQELSRDFGSVRAAFVEVKDYDARPATRVTPPTNDISTIRRALAGCRASHGGDGPEAYRTGLHDVLAMKGITDDHEEAQRVLVLVADCWPHFDADPNSTQGHLEVAALDRREQCSKENIHYRRWSDLCVALADEGIQCFTLIPATYQNLPGQYLPYVQLAEASGGMVLHVQGSDSQSISSCLLTLFKALVDGRGGDAINLPPSLAVFGRDRENRANDWPEDDKDMVALGQSGKHGAASVTDRAEIVSSFERCRAYFRLTAQDKGFKRARAHVSVNMLVDIAPVLARALAMTHHILAGTDDTTTAPVASGAWASMDSSGSEAEEHVTAACTRLEKILIDIQSNSQASNIDNNTCEEPLVDVVSLTSQREALADFADRVDSGELFAEAEAAKDPVEFWIDNFGGLFMGHPFLIELAEGGKFNFQDPWAMPVKKVFPQVISLTTASKLLSANTGSSSIARVAAETRAPIETCRSLFRDGRMSGVVGLARVNDPCGSAVTRVLHAGSWGDALAAYLAHGHIEPLPYVWQATLGASMVEYLLKNIGAQDGAGTEAHDRSLDALAQTLRVLPRVGGESTKAIDALLTGAASGSFVQAMSPREPMNVGAWSRVATMVTQLPRSTATLRSPTIMRLVRAVLGEFIAFYVALTQRHLGDAAARAKFLSERLAPQCMDPRETSPHNKHELDEFYDTEVHINSPSEFAAALRVHGATCKWLTVVCPELVESCRQVTDIEVIAAYCEAILLGNRANRFDSGGRATAVGVADSPEQARHLLSRVRFDSLRTYYRESLDGLKQRRLAAGRVLVAKSAAASFYGPQGATGLCEVLNREVNVGGVKHMPDADDVPSILQSMIEGDDSTLVPVDARSMLLLLCTGRRDPITIVTPEWGDARRFSDLSMLRAVGKLFFEEEDVDALIDVVGQAVARAIPNRHGHHAIRLPARQTYSRTYCRRRLANLLAPGLESRICACGDLPTHGPSPVIPARCRSCSLPTDVRLSACPARPATYCRNRKALRQMRRLAEEAGEDPSVIDTLLAEVMSSLSDLSDK